MKKLIILYFIFLLFVFSCGTLNTNKRNEVFFKNAFLNYKNEVNSEFSYDDYIFEVYTNNDDIITFDFFLNPKLGLKGGGARYTFNKKEMKIINYEFYK